MIPYNRQPVTERATGVVSETSLPAAGKSFLLALLPVLLIAAGTLGNQLIAPGNVVFAFLQEPVTAFLFSFVLMQVLLRISTTSISNGCAEAVKSIAVILLVIAAGGAFKQVLIDSGTAAEVAGTAKSLSVPPLVFGWAVAALLRLAIGSATVAAITAAGMVVPVMSMVAVPELMVLSVGAGSVFGSHVNDTGFWMFKEYFNLSLKQTLRTWTVVETCISVLGLGGVLLLQLLL
jgi:H+/gluconate symporter-like permease